MLLVAQHQLGLSRMARLACSLTFLPIVAAMPIAITPPPVTVNIGFLAAFATVITIGVLMIKVHDRFPAIRRVRVPPSTVRGHYALETLAPSDPEDRLLVPYDRLPSQCGPSLCWVPLARLRDTPIFNAQLDEMDAGWWTAPTRLRCSCEVAGGGGKCSRLAVRAVLGLPSTHPSYRLVVLFCAECCLDYQCRCSCTPCAGAPGAPERVSPRPPGIAFVAPRLLSVDSPRLASESWLPRWMAFSETLLTSPSFHRVIPSLLQEYAPWIWERALAAPEYDGGFIDYLYMPDSSLRPDRATELYHAMVWAPVSHPDFSDPPANASRVDSSLNRAAIDNGNGQMIYRHVSDAEFQAEFLQIPRAPGTVRTWRSQCECGFHVALLTPGSQVHTRPRPDDPWRPPPPFACTNRAVMTVILLPYPIYGPVAHEYHNSSMRLRRLCVPCVQFYLRQNWPRAAGCPTVTPARCGCACQFCATASPPVPHPSGAVLDYPPPPTYASDPGRATRLHLWALPVGTRRVTPIMIAGTFLAGAGHAIASDTIPAVTTPPSEYWAPSGLAILVLVLCGGLLGTWLTRGYKRQQALLVRISSRLCLPSCIASLWPLLLAGCGGVGACVMSQYRQYMTSATQLIFDRFLLNSVLSDGSYCGAIKGLAQGALPWATACAIWALTSSSGIRQHHARSANLRNGIFMAISSGWYYLNAEGPPVANALVGILLALVPPHLGPAIPNHAAPITRETLIRLSYTVFPAALMHLTYWHPGPIVICLTVGYSALLIITEIKSLKGCWKYEWQYCPLHRSLPQIAALLTLRAVHWTAAPMLAVLTILAARAAPMHGPLLVRAIGFTMWPLFVFSVTYVDLRSALHEDTIANFEYYKAKQPAIHTQWTRLLRVAAFGIPDRLLSSVSAPPQGARAPFWGRVTMRALVLLFSLASHHAETWHDAGLWHLLSVIVTGLDALMHHRRTISRLTSVPRPRHRLWRWVLCMLTPWALCVRGGQALLGLAWSPRPLGYLLLGGCACAFFARALPRMFRPRLPRALTSPTAGSTLSKSGVLAIYITCGYWPLRIGAPLGSLVGMLWLATRRPRPRTPQPSPSPAPSAGLPASALRRPRPRTATPRQCTSGRHGRRRRYWHNIQRWRCRATPLPSGTSRTRTPHLSQCRPMRPRPRKAYAPKLLRSTRAWRRQRKHWRNYFRPCPPGPPGRPVVELTHARPGLLRYASGHIRKGVHLMRLPPIPSCGLVNFHVALCSRLFPQPVIPRRRQIRPLPSPVTIGLRSSPTSHWILGTVLIYASYATLASSWALDLPRWTVPTAAVMLDALARGALAIYQRLPRVPRRRQCLHRPSPSRLLGPFVAHAATCLPSWRSAVPPCRPPARRTSRLSFGRAQLCAFLLLCLIGTSSGERMWSTYGEASPLTELQLPAMSTVPGEAFPSPEWTSDSQPPYSHRFPGRSSSPALGTIPIPDAPLARRDKRRPTTTLPASASLVTATLNVANKSLMCTTGIASSATPHGAPTLEPFTSPLSTGLHEIALWMNVMGIDVLFLQEVNILPAQEPRAMRDIAPFRLFLSPATPKRGQAADSGNRNAGCAILLAPRLGRLCPTSFVMSDGRMVACRVVFDAGTPITFVSAYMYSDPFDKCASNPTFDDPQLAPGARTTLDLLRNIPGDLLPERSLRHRAATHQMLNVADFCRECHEDGDTVILGADINLAAIGSHKAAQAQAQRRVLFAGAAMLCDVMTQSFSCPPDTRRQHDLSTSIDGIFFSTPRPASTPIARVGVDWAPPIHGMDHAVVAVLFDLDKLTGVHSLPYRPPPLQTLVSPGTPMPDVNLWTDEQWDDYTNELASSASRERLTSLRESLHRAARSFDDLATGDKPSGRSALAAAIDLILTEFRSHLTAALLVVEPKRPPQPPGRWPMGHTRLYRQARSDSRALTRVIETARRALRETVRAQPWGFSAPFALPVVATAVRLSCDTLLTEDGLLPDWVVCPTMATQSAWTSYIAQLTTKRQEFRVAGAQEMSKITQYNSDRWSNATHSWFNKGGYYLRFFMQQIRRKVHLRADIHGSFRADGSWTFDPAETLACKVTDAQEWHGLACERKLTQPSDASVQADPSLSDLARHLTNKPGTFPAMWDPTLGEITPAVLNASFKGASKGKAAGSSRLRLHAYFHAGPDSVELLADIFNVILLHQACPSSWLFRLIVHVPKSTNLAEVMAGAVRPISLLETDQRFFYRIINHRVMEVLRQHPGKVIDDLQACLPGGGCIGPLQILINILFHHCWLKLPLYVLYTDLRRAFDSVEPWAIRLSCERVNMPPELVNVFMMMHTAPMASLVTSMGRTPAFSIPRGVAQGSSESPLVFCLFMDILSSLQKDPVVSSPPAVPPDEAPPPKPGEHPLAAVLPYGSTDSSTAFVGSQYADDGVWAATSWWGAHLRASRVDTFLRFFGVSLNVTKSAVTGTAASGISSKEPIQMWSAVKQCYLPVPIKSPSEPYKYLGIWITATLDWSFQLTSLETVVRTKLLTLRAATKRCLTVREARTYLTSAIWGAVAYSFAVTPVLWSRLTAWDDAAASHILLACRIPRKGTLDRLFHPIIACGQALPSCRSLWLECHCTEWLVALQAPGMVGATSRASMLLYQSIRGVPNPLGYPSSTRTTGLRAHAVLWTLEHNMQLANVAVHTTDPMFAPPLFHSRFDTPIHCMLDWITASLVGDDHKDYDVKVTRESTLIRASYVTSLQKERALGPTGFDLYWFSSLVELQGSYAGRCFRTLPISVASTLWFQRLIGHVSPTAEHQLVNGGLTPALLANPPAPWQLAPRFYLPLEAEVPPTSTLHMPAPFCVEARPPPIIPLAAFRSPDALPLHGRTPGPDLPLIIGGDASGRDNSYTYAVLTLPVMDTSQPRTTGVPWKGERPVLAHRARVRHCECSTDAEALVIADAVRSLLFHRRSGEVYTDSESCVSRFQRTVREISQPVTNRRSVCCSARATWRSVARALAELHSYGLSMEVHHVRSHQDRTKALADLDFAATINVAADHEAEKAHHDRAPVWADQEADFPPDEVSWMLFTPNCLSPDQPHVGFPTEICPGNPRKAIRACVPWALAMSYASAAPRHGTSGSFKLLLQQCLASAYVLSTIRASVHGADEFAGWRLRYRLLNGLIAPLPDMLASKGRATDPDSIPGEQVPCRRCNSALMSDEHLLFGCPATMAPTYSPNANDSSSLAYNLGELLALAPGAAWRDLPHDLGSRAEALALIPIQTNGRCRPWAIPEDSLCTPAQARKFKAKAIKAALNASRTPQETPGPERKRGTKPKAPKTSSSVAPCIGIWASPTDQGPPVFSLIENVFWRLRRVFSQVLRDHPRYIPRGHPQADVAFPTLVEHHLDPADFATELLALFRRHEGSLTPHAARNCYSLPTDFVERLLDMFPDLEVEAFSCVFNCSYMLPYAFSLPPPPTDGSPLVTDWMWKVGYDATARPWRRPTLFNSEYTSGAVNTEPLEAACAMARESVEWANSNGTAMQHIGVFPNAHPDKLRELILTSHGTIAVIFPPKSFAFTPFLALFGMAKMGKSFYKKGVVLATFRSEFYTTRPTLASKRRMHEWWALHAPTPLVASAKWPDPWWCLDGPIPLQGHFLPRWPIVDTYLSWADPQANYIRQPTAPYDDDHPMAVLANMSYKDTRWTYLGLVPTVFQDLLLSAGIPTGVLSSALKNHTTRTLAWLNTAWIKHNATLIMEGDARRDANLARKEARLLAAPAPTPDPNAKPVDVQCYGPPPAATHRRFTGHRILTPALVSDAVPDARPSAIKSKPKLPRPDGGIHASVAPPHVLMSNNAGYKISNHTDAGAQVASFGIDYRIRQHMLPHLTRLWQGGYDASLSGRLWPLTAPIEAASPVCALCLTPRRSSAVCDKMVVWHKWGSATKVCKRCNHNFVQQSDWRFFTVIHVCAAAYLIHLGGFPMDKSFKAVNTSREARTSAYPTILEGPLNHLLGELYDEFQAAHPETTAPRGSDTAPAADRTSQAALCQPVPLELLMSPSWATSLDIAVQWATRLQVPDTMVTNMIGQVESHSVLKDVQLTARVIAHSSASSNNARLAAIAANRAYVMSLSPAAKKLFQKQKRRDNIAANRAKRTVRHAEPRRPSTGTDHVDPAPPEGPGPPPPTPPTPTRPVSWPTRRPQTQAIPASRPKPQRNIPESPSAPDSFNPATPPVQPRPIDTLSAESDGNDRSVDAIMVDDDVEEGSTVPPITGPPLHPLIWVLCDSLLPRDLSTVEGSLLGLTATSIRSMEWPDIPGWLPAPSDSSDIDSEASTAGTRRMTQALARATEQLQSSTTAHSRAIRMATIQSSLHSSRPSRHHGTRAAAFRTAASGHRDKMRHAQSSVDRLANALDLARGHRFERPPSPLDHAWDVGLPTDAAVRDLMIGPSKTTLVQSKHAMSITRASLLRLQPGRSDEQYLSSEIIDLYMALLNEAIPNCGGGLHTDAAPNGTRLHIMPSQLILYLYECDGGPPCFQRAHDSRLFDSVPLDSLDLLAFPFSPLGSQHWWAIVFDFRSETIHVCDSMGWATASHPTVQHLGSLLSHILNDDYKVAQSFLDWTVISTGLPRQSNAYDCGVFMCMYVLHLGFAAPMLFDQSDMDRCRMHIARRILADTFYMDGSRPPAPPTPPSPSIDLPDPMALTTPPHAYTASPPASEAIPPHRAPPEITPPPTPPRQLSPLTPHPWDAYGGYDGGPASPGNASWSLSPSTASPCPSPDPLPTRVRHRPPLYQCDLGTWLLPPLPCSPHPAPPPYDEYGAWDGGPLSPGNAPPSSPEDHAATPPRSPATSTPTDEGALSPPLLGTPFPITIHATPPGQPCSSETHCLSLLATQLAPGPPNPPASPPHPPTPPVPALAVGADEHCTPIPLSLSVEGSSGLRVTTSATSSAGGGVCVSTAYPPESRGLKRGPGGPLSPPSPPPWLRARPPPPSPPQRGGTPGARTDPSSRKVP